MEHGERYGVRALFYIQKIVRQFQSSNKTLTYVKVGTIPFVYYLNVLSTQIVGHR